MSRGRALGGRTVGAVVVAAVAAATIAVGYAVTSRPRTGAQAGTGPVPTGTARVTRGTVSERLTVAGTLGFDGSYQIVNQHQPGVLTSTAAAGSTVGRGATLYTVDGSSVRLLYGGTPGYRAFAAGMTDGADVRELEANLAAMGLRPGTVDNHFSSSTAAAIRRWQVALGLPVAARTGALEPGEVLFLPAAVRVGQVSATVGAQLAPDAVVFAASGTGRVVTVSLSTDQITLVHVGVPVVVLLPGSAGQVDGRVSRIARVASAPTGGSNGGGGGGNGGGGGGGGGDQGVPPTVPVTVALRLPPAAAGLDQAPVQVYLTTQEHPDVLMVPVTALLARPGGGYQVRLASGRYVAVEPGLFDDSTGSVEVAGAGLSDGDQVEVPAS
jgi:peptidoglycan hydrolase-like protein with peptidoglycan-binding domain